MISILQVNTNGILSFRSQFTAFFPQRFPLFGSPLIAPFWDDVNINRFGNIFYRQTSSATLLQRVRNELQELFPSSGNFNPTRLLIATWDRVAEFGSGSQVPCCIISVCLLLYEHCWLYFTYTLHCYCRKTHSRL